MPDSDEVLCARLRDLALVDLDALVVGDATELVVAFSEDVAATLRETRARIAALRTVLGGADPLGVIDASPQQRGSEAGTAGAARVRHRLVQQADAARALARLAELAANLVGKLFEADRRT